MNDLISRWHPDRGNDFDHSSLVTPDKPGSQNPPQKKRRTEKATTKKSKIPVGSNSENKSRDLSSTNPKKSVEFSSNLTAQEILDITRFNSVFPPQSLVTGMLQF